MANSHHGIRLVDTESLFCITTFNFPSAAASVQCLAWVPSAPGMFITGGKCTLFLKVLNMCVFFNSVREITLLLVNFVSNLLNLKYYLL